MNLTCCILKHWFSTIYFLVYYFNCKLHFFRSEKFLVVLLVATGTVCFLTNSLVLLILLKQRGKLCLRYQVILSQAWAGVLTAAVTFYPLKVRIGVHHARLLPQNVPPFNIFHVIWERQICIFNCGLPYLLCRYVPRITDLTNRYAWQRRVLN